VPRASCTRAGGLDMLRSLGGHEKAAQGRFREDFRTPAASETLHENRRSAFRRDKLKADIIIRLQSGAVSLVLTVSRLVGIPF
jgi:hypothetical protein